MAAEYVAGRLQARDRQKSDLSEKTELIELRLRMKAEQESAEDRPYLDNGQNDAMLVAVASTQVEINQHRCF